MGVQRGAGSTPQAAAALGGVLGLLAACTHAAQSPAAAPPGLLSVAGATVQLEPEAADFTHGSAPIVDWVRRSGQIVAAYYGHFPVPRLTLRLSLRGGDGVHGGTTYARPEAYIRVGVGREVTPAQLSADWVLVHEMTHLALPDTGESHAWLSEGLATYVEGVARVQAGNRSEADMWAEELHAMPRGLPEDGDRGLDHTHSWGRTYWGGAMFCLLADVQIRQRTHNRLGLQDALRAILTASGGLATDWPIARVLHTGDAAVGVPVLEELYARYADAPATPDLAGLWRDLGVEPDGNSVRFNEAAPLAPIRRAILTPR